MTSDPNDSQKFSLYLKDPEAVRDHVNLHKVGLLSEIPKDWKILAISPHPDDTAITCGGTLSHFKANGCSVDVLFMVTGFTGVTEEFARTNCPAGMEYTEENRQKIGATIREAEATRDVTELLGEAGHAHFARMPFYERDHKEILSTAEAKGEIEHLRGILKNLSFDTVFLPQPYDNHRTHRNCTNIVLWTLLKMFYEEEVDVDRILYYETPWSPFGLNEYNMVVGLDQTAFERKLAATACHESQLERTPYIDISESLAKLRAGVTGEFHLSLLGKKSPVLGEGIEVFQYMKIDEADRYYLERETARSTEEEVVSLLHDLEDDLPFEETRKQWINVEELLHAFEINLEVKGLDRNLIRRSIVVEVLRRYHSDLETLFHSQRQGPNVYQQAGFLAFWIRKLKPIMIPEELDKGAGGSTEKLRWINESVALEMAIAIIYSQRGYRPAILSDPNSRYALLYQLRFGDLSTATLSLILEVVWETPRRERKAW